MAKEDKKNGSTAIAEQPAKETGVATAQPIVSNEQAAEMLKNAKRGEQDSGYLNFKPGQIVRVVFKGWKPIPSLDKSQPEGATVNAAIFTTDSGREQINADSAIRSYFEKLPIGCRKEIECKGMTKGPKGDYKTFDFFELVD
jgi:hypothetical protein